jgi:hypothetical protein
MTQGKKRFVRITLFFLLFVLIFLLARIFIRNDRKEVSPPLSAGGRAGGSGEMALLTDTAAPSDTATPTNAAAGKKGPGRAKPVSAGAVDRARPPAQDTARKADTAAAPLPIERDVTPPYVHAEPGPGLHPAPILVRLFADEPAVISFRTDRDTAWKPYRDAIPVKDSLTLFFRGVDSAGNVSEEVQRQYVIAKPAKIKCPADMVPVETEKTAFCIDLYEWPNRKGVMPTGFVNWYMAYDSCRADKKRLCSAEEWEAACGGKGGSAYPYGNAYEIRACNTESGGPVPSGSLEECRSFFGVYDLSGNLREWTSTKSARNERHYQVYGGYWENRGASQCNSTQYSFFPENKFITIGFRCCK